MLFEQAFSLSDVPNNTTPLLTSKSPIVLPALSEPWWVPYFPHMSVSPQTGHLLFCGKSVETLAKEHGTPLYLYSREAVRQRVQNVYKEFTKHDLEFDLCYAMKACKLPHILSVFKEEKTMVDAVSPQEVQLALESGFLPSEVSVTGTMHSNRDLKFFAEAKVHINLDGFSQISRYAKFVPRGTPIGLRIDPGRCVKGGADALKYTHTKFGIPLQEMKEALELCSELGLVVVCFHTHLSWNIQEEGAQEMEKAFKEVASLAQLLPPGQLKMVNVGGGLGARLNKQHRPLSLERWAQIITRSFGHLKPRILAELGSFVVAESCLLVTEVTTVQKKMGSTWLGLDSGFNINPFPLMLGVLQDLVHVTRPLQPPTRKYHIGGNINAPTDVFGFDVSFGEVNEEEFVGFLSSGAYALEKANHFCGRGPYFVLVL